MVFLSFMIPLTIFAGKDDSTVKLGLLKYRGGDWYSNPTALPNLIEFANVQLSTNIDPNPVTVEAGSPEVFNLPFLYMTGHGNIIFNQQEATNLRNYLRAGGFLHIDDNYGMDPFVRPALQMIFPDHQLIELPFDHPVYHQTFSFPDGLPKIHEHDGKPPQGFGLFYEGRMVVFYSYESDLGNGWEDQMVHNNPEDIRQKALRMGANLLEYLFTETD